MSIEEKARLEGTLALTPIVITPDDLMVIARLLTTVAQNKTQAGQKIYHQLSSSIVLVYDPGITLMSDTAQKSANLPGTAMSNTFEKSIQDTVNLEDLQ